MLAPVQNDGGRQGVIMSECEGFAVVVRGTLIVIRSEREGSAAVVRKAVRRHPERQRRIYYRSEEDGKMSSES